MAHPNFQLAIEPVEEAVHMYCRSSMLLYFNLCLSVFFLLSCSNRVTCKVPGNGLKAVANTEYGDVEFEDCER